MIQQHNSHRAAEYDCSGYATHDEKYLPMWAFRGIAHFYASFLKLSVF
jgi:hypothetical protein